MVNWLVSKAANAANVNGGTSINILATASDGVTNGTNTFTSASALFTAGMVGQGLYIGTVSQLRLITAYNSATSVVFSGATIASGSGKTYTVGGPMLDIAEIVNTQAAVLSAGDNIYVGAGVYRQTPTIAASGSAGQPISLIGDVDGKFTGQPGEVQVTAFTTNDTTTPANAANMALGTNNYWNFSNITFVGGQTNNWTIGASVTNVNFTDCSFLASANHTCISIANTAAVSSNITVDRCSFMTTGSAITPVLTTGASGADYNSNIVIKNSLIMSVGSSISITASGTNPQNGGGVLAYNCTIFSGATPFICGTAAHLSISIPCAVYNSVLFGSTVVSAATAGQVIENWNYLNGGTARSNVTAGAGSFFNQYSPLLDIGQQYKWAGLARPFMSPSSAASPINGFVSNASPGLQSYDWQNRIRPAGSSNGQTAAGYLDYHDSATQDTTVFDVGPSSAQLTGPGDIELRLPVDAVSQTITVRCLYTAGYGGTTTSMPNFYEQWITNPPGHPGWKPPSPESIEGTSIILPQAQILSNGEIGVTAQTVSAVSGMPNQWQTLTFNTFTPTASGWLILRLLSFDTSGTGVVHFDTISVS